VRLPASQTVIRRGDRRVVRDLQRHRIVKWIHIALVPVSLSLAACASHGRAVSARADASAPSPLAHSSRAQTLDALGRAPLAFETVDDGNGRYACRTPSYTLRLAPTWAELDRPSAAPRIGMRLLEASPDATVGTADPLVTRVNYMLGDDPARWRANVRTFERVRYNAVYPGIDLVYYGTSNEIEHDFLVSPGSRPDRIVWAFEGAGTLRLQPNGDLQLTDGPAPIVFRAPKAYQLKEGKPQPIDVRYKLLNDAHVGFEVARYDATQPLVIDPILNVAATLGGRNEDEGAAIAVDGNGNIYIAGVTASTDFPASGANAGGLDIFVLKLDASGTHVLSSSYLGGSRTDDARAIAVDATGNVYVAGVTNSPDFPMKNAGYPTLNGDSDAFVLKLSTTGAGLIFSTYLGGSGNDEAHGIAIDAAHNIYVTGDTSSTNFPVSNAIQPTLGGNLDAFVTKLSPAGTAIIYSTFLGGADTDSAQAIAADATGNVSIVGNTVSTNFPISNAVQNTLQGDADAFVTRLQPNGALTFSTYLGGSAVDAARAVTVDGIGNTFLTGSTLSTNFPVTPQAGQSASHGGLDAFVSVLTPSGGLYQSTYLGGSGSDRGHAIALDGYARLYVAGQTMSTDFPVLNAAQPTIMGDRDAFIAMLPPPYVSPGYATYLGTGDNDDSLSVAADRIGRAYLTGVKTYSWPATTGNSDAFVMRLSTQNDVIDEDHDGMPDDWETRYGLDPTHNDANDDPDGDGVSNLDEYQADTNPMGFYTRYLAEGATGSFFDDQVALFNTSASVTATALLRFQKDDQTEVHQLVQLPPHARRTVFPRTIPGLASANFSTVIESNTDVIADRTMTWDKTAYGAHAETAGDELSKVWYLAEGSTGGFFDLYYLLQNPGGSTANVTVTYLLPFGLPPIKRMYTVAPHSRYTIHVDDEKAPLNNTDLSAQIDSDQPILVERAMYMTTGGKIYSAGHDAAGVTSPARTWFLAEGATGVFFDLFILMANPNTAPTTANVEYLLPDGRIITKQYDLPAQSRVTIPVDGEDPALLDTPVSTRVNAPVPIVVERAMWWPSPVWYEAHDSVGAVVTAPKWAVAEGQEGGASEAQTFILIANTSNVGGQVDVTVYLEDDTAPITKRFAVLPNSRFNVHVEDDFPAARDQRYSTIVESVGAPLDLVVERATYMNSGKVTWAAGTNSLGTPIFADNTVLITSNGAFPKHVIVPDGSRVAFVNRDTVPHAMKSAPHPCNTDCQCPAISVSSTASPIAPGETRLSSNLVFDDGSNRCSFLDDSIFNNQAYWGEIVIKPPSIP
jgi:hypothetical protein